jgi:hypothetical protein
MPGWHRTGKTAATLAKVITIEQFEKELDLRERLDAAIDRCARRILQLKAGKRMVQLDSRAKALPKPQGTPQPNLRSV